MLTRKFDHDIQERDECHPRQDEVKPSTSTKGEPKLLFVAHIYVYRLLSGFLVHFDVLSFPNCPMPGWARGFRQQYYPDVCVRASLETANHRMISFKGKKRQCLRTNELETTTNVDDIAHLRRRLM
jgi:hypothetical protein